MTQPFVIRALVFSLLCCAVAAARDDSPSPARVLPLNDLGPGLYQGQMGGLYPRGLNMPPGEMRLAGLARAARIVPLDRQGNFAPEWGRIGLITLGTARTRVVAEQARRLMAADEGKSAVVVAVNGAAGTSLHPMASDGDRAWSLLPQLVASAGLTNAQVQVAWLDATGALDALPFPDNTLQLQADLAAIAAHARQLFPSLKVVFVSSGAYGGHAGPGPARDSYEAGFGVQALIAQQAGAAASAPAPWMAWGPYLWADGGKPRSDGLVWSRGDFLADGLQLSPAGAGKVARLLVDFLHHDALARSWYLAEPGTSCPKPAMASTFGSSRVGDGAPSIAAGALPILSSTEALRIAVSGAPAKARGMFLVALANQPGALLAEGPLLVAPDHAQALPVLADSSGTARLELGHAGLVRERFCGLTLVVQYACAEDGALIASPGLRLQTGH
jgi:hypothetical protein